ncbi:MAG: HDOD domain-containing protein [Capsulimonadaceae bacterium]|nr:HDOD domain-containing protein [Capsulimonadaceae bacterium]
MGTLPKILFVDDERNILQGLQRMLRPERHIWDMTFAGGSVEALYELEQSAFDIVVTDMRMPVMNGAELLEEIRRRYPSTARMALSGHTDREFIFRVVSSTHQFLSKPCDADVIKNALSRCIAASALIENKELRANIGSSQAVAIFPANLESFQNALVWGESSASKVGRIVERDIGLTAKCLQFVNSAFFGTPREICLPEQAVAMIGIETLREVYGSPDLRSEFPENEFNHLKPMDLADHSMLTARIARLIAESEDLPARTADAVFIAGMLHDVGKLIFAATNPAACDSLPCWSGQDTRNRETELFGACHCRAGAYLLSLWGFQPNVVSAVAWHHAPMALADEPSWPLTIVHVANLLANEFAGTRDRSDDYDERYLIATNTLDKLAGWKQTAAGAIMNGAVR